MSHIPLLYIMSLVEKLRSISARPFPPPPPSCFLILPIIRSFVPVSHVSRFLYPIYIAGSISPRLYLAASPPQKKELISGKSISNQALKNYSRWHPVVNLLHFDHIIKSAFFFFRIPMSCVQTETCVTFQPETMAQNPRNKASARYISISL